MQFSNLELVRKASARALAGLTRGAQKKLNMKVKDSLAETLIISNKIITSLVSGVLKDVGALYKASEAVRALFAGSS